MACAQTGSGEDGGVLLPHHPRHPDARFERRPERRTKDVPERARDRATRELAIQIHEESRKFAYQTGVRSVVVYGGAPAAQQFREMERGCDILIATPGRLIDLVDRAKISLSNVAYLALDEADRMLDMGFEPQIRQIVEQRDMPPPGDRQTMLFSATFPKEIQRMASDFLHDYIFPRWGASGRRTTSSRSRWSTSRGTRTRSPCSWTWCPRCRASRWCSPRRSAAPTSSRTGSAGRASRARPSTATARSRSASGRSSSSAAARRPSWSRRTSPREGWTSRTSRTSSTLTCRATSTTTCTASAAPGARGKRGWRRRSSPTRTAA